MLKYFRKRKNFNRIKKLIKTKEIKEFTNIAGFLTRTAYLIDDTVYIIQDDNPYKYGWYYGVLEGGKEVYLDYSDCWRLFDLAKEQYRFNNSV